MPASADYVRRGLPGGAKASTLSGDHSAVATALAGADLSTWAGATTNGPICWTLDRGLASEESGEATGVSGNNLTGVTRGLFGTTGQAHTSGAALELTASKKDFDEANQAVVQTIGKATTAGDLLYATAASVLARLGIGTANQALYTNAGATAPTWGASAKSALTTTGDVLYASAANTLARLAVGSTGQVLTVAGGVPTWAAASGVTTAQATRTTGDVVLNDAGAFTANVDTGLDLTLAAVAGSVVQLGFGGSFASEAVITALDFVTVTGGNFVSSGTTTPYTWGIPGSRSEASDDLAVSFTTLYTVQSGDLSGGNVVFRLRYKTHVATNKTLYASGGINTRVWAAKLA